MAHLVSSMKLNNRTHYNFGSLPVGLIADLMLVCLHSQREFSEKIIAIPTVFHTKLKLMSNFKMIPTHQNHLPVRSVICPPEERFGLLICLFVLWLWFVKSNFCETSWKTLFFTRCVHGLNCIKNISDCALKRVIILILWPTFTDWNVYICKICKI